MPWARGHKRPSASRAQTDFTKRPSRCARPPNTLQAEAARGRRSGHKRGSPRTAAQAGRAGRDGTGPSGDRSPGGGRRAESLGAEQTNARRSRNPAAPPPPARSGRNARGSARTAALRLTSAAPGLLRRRRRRHTLGPGAPRRRCRVRTATGRGARAEPAARLRRAERGRAGLGMRAAGRPAATSCTPSAEGRNGLCLRPSLGSGGGVGGSRFPSLRGIPPNKKRAAKQKGWEAAAMCRFCSSLAPGESLGDRAVVKRRDKEITKDDAVTQSCQCHTEPLAFICLLEKRPGQRSR